MNKNRKKCVVCGTKFVPYINSQKYCSDKCRVKGRSRKAEKQNKGLDDYISYCKTFGHISYAEYQTKVLRKCGV